MEKPVAPYDFVATGEDLWRAEKKEEAIQILKLGLESHPDCLPGLIVLGRYCAEAGDTASALTLFNRALKLDPENIVVYHLIAQLLAPSGDEKSLVETWEAILHLDPYHPEAKAYFAKTSAHHPPIATISIAELYESQGYWTEAIDIYKELASRDPDNELLKAKIAALTTKKGQ